MPGGGNETVSNGFNLFVPPQPVPLDQSPQFFSKTSLSMVRLLSGHVRGNLSCGGVSHRKCPVALRPPKLAWNHVVNAETWASMVLRGPAPQAEKPLETVSTRPGPSGTALKRRC